MPVIDRIEQEDHTKILVWQVTESEEVLLRKLFLPDEEIKKYYYLAPNRQKEFLGIRCALKSLGLVPIVYYDVNGKPFLNEKCHISLSHSCQRIAIAISDRPIGVDIEKCKPDKIFNIRKKFLRADEAVFVNPTYEVDQLHIIWGIKESLYKLHGGELSGFLNHYKVAPFSIGDVRIKCWIIDALHSKIFWSFHKKIGDFHLIYVYE
ncbi:MAG: 4'-phosphopantetheinyl transferase family protein [Flavobacteriales bacterium AspAUS03]